VATSYGPPNGDGSEGIYIYITNICRM